MLAHPRGHPTLGRPAILMFISLYDVNASVLDQTIERICDALDSMIRFRLRRSTLRAGPWPVWTGGSRWSIMG